MIGIFLIVVYVILSLLALWAGITVVAVVIGYTKEFINQWKKH
jgi:hypothetical protein